MLQITPNAGLAIATLAAGSGGGLRIETRSPQRNGDGPAFDLSVDALAATGDAVVTEPTTGAKVFLDELAADYLEDTVLDVVDTVDGDAKFRLTPQAD